VTIEQLFGSRTAVIVPDAIGAAEADALRARLTGFERYRLLDRGSYEYLDDVDEPALFARLAALASRLCGRPLAITGARALRLVPGDYILAHHDRLHDDLPVELVLDLSPAPVPADLHYRRRGHVFFRVPCEPRTLAVVERGPTVTRNHVYVSKRCADAHVVRLVMLATCGA